MRLAPIVRRQVQSTTKHLTMMSKDAEWGCHLKCRHELQALDNVDIHDVRLTKSIPSCTLGVTRTICSRFSPHNPRTQPYLAAPPSRLQADLALPFHLSASWRTPPGIEPRPA